MAETVKNHDFIELDYTGRLIDGTVFDTTVASEAKDLGKRDFKPVIICVGEKQLLPGLDGALVDKETGKKVSITLSPEQAFGKRDVKKMKIVPMGAFQEHKVRPEPGLQINIDGELGTITRVSGGRVIVNFNHPLAGREVVYEVFIHRRITDAKEQITSFLQTTFNLPKGAVKVEITGEKASVELPMVLPEPLLEVIRKKLSELTVCKEVVLSCKSPEKK
ncbi:peptidylprolyl isomerase [Candidatus Woesearchaeota archaeon CG10_big_fil_rev_8_21_14_0_10_45_16]|nr:MAG: peptidylprolyl isomerase [Candidatus Woesearchaeota archaeon CG10_big_fil_rev_8_21_14_0_10_45_16]